MLLLHSRSLPRRKIGRLYKVNLLNCLFGNENLMVSLFRLFQILHTLCFPYNTFFWKFAHFPNETAGHGRRFWPALLTFE